MKTWMKNLLKVVGFWGLAALIFWVIQPLYLDQGEVLRWADFKRVEKNSLDIIFLGSSHAYHSFNPEVIDELIPTNSFALGIPGDNLPIVYHEIEEIFRHQNPRLIVLDAFTFSISHWRDGSFVYRFLNSGNDLHYLRYAIDILFKNQYVWWNYFPAIRYRDEWKDPANFIENPKSTKPFDFVHNAKGFAPLENIIRDQTYAEMPREGYIPPPANYLQSMRKILDLSREHGFELMVFDTIWYGFTNPVFDLYDPGAVYDLMEKEGLDYVDFREAPIAYDWKQIHLYDVDHPSTFGSLIISLRMAEYLAQKYDLPLDGEKMEYYQTYFFNEHVIERNGRGLTIRLVPADVSAPLLYAWEVTHDGRVVETSDFGADPTFSFNMSSSGDYLIRVQVWNPNGDYVLPAVFTYTLN